MTQRREAIAFICLHGSAKSVLAAEYLNRRAQAQGLALHATASGLEPDDALPRYVVDGLRERGYAVGERRPVPVSPEILAGAQRIVAFGCPIEGFAPAGSAIEQWSDCPAVSEGFGPAWAFITDRVDRLLATCKPLAAGAIASAALGAQGATLDFDRETPGAAPAGWTCGVTGKGTPVWKVEADASAPSAPHVLKQSGAGTFPWCVRKDVSLTDGFVEVKFKPLAGREDQAGGVVWRWKDGDHYYVARANALENNVSLYYTERGSRKTLRYVDAPVAANHWHRLRVEFSGPRIRVLLDGRAWIEMEDRHIEGAGAVGVWTKADSVTAFDDFAYGP